MYTITSKHTPLFSEDKLHTRSLTLDLPHPPSFLNTGYIRTPSFLNTYTFMLENRYAHYTLIVEHRLHACTLILEQYILTLCCYSTIIGTLIEVQGRTAGMDIVVMDLLIVDHFCDPINLLLSLSCAACHFYFPCNHGTAFSV